MFKRSDAQNATIGDGQGQGTIQNDDTAGINLVKLTNGSDNDSPPGPTVPVGSTVTFTYIVTNTGNVPLSNVGVTDNNGTSGNPADDFNPTFVGGDTNGNGLLDTTETFTFTAGRIATAGQYTNIGTAAGIPPGGATVATSMNSDSHFGVAPASPTPTATATATASPTPAATATATASPTAAPGLVANVSTRLPVGTGDNALIEGFIVQGPPGSTKKVLVRALGPSLLPFGITDALTNPTLEIFDANNTRVASNDNWKTTQVGGIITGDQAAEINASGLAPSNDSESAIIADLAPGDFTAVVRGFGNTAGTGVVDAFDLSASSTARLANVATRGLIQPGDKLMIAGFIIQNGSARTVIRAIGPSLTAFGITNALPDTTLQLRDQNGTIVRENDDWMTDQKAELESTGLQPTNELEAALVETILPGQYTAQVRGKPEATGTGVVQVYFLQ